MSGIKDLAVLMHWMDNKQQPTLEAFLFKTRKVPRERQLILNDLQEAANQAVVLNKKNESVGHFTKELLSS
jgi:hypothetical protein